MQKTLIGAIALLVASLAACSTSTGTIAPVATFGSNLVLRRRSRTRAPPTIQIHPGGNIFGVGVGP